MTGPLGRVVFGGPDFPPGQLRDLLEDHVNRARPGSRIDWATYYFRDRALARALMRASDRGARVRLVMEPRPRRHDANEPVIAMLKAHGLGGGFQLYSPAGSRPAVGRLHAKIYAFSDPDICWVGSFNPSGDQPEDPEVIAEIGDQDRGHNLLLGIERPHLVQGLRNFIDQLASNPAEGWWTRLSSNRSLGGEDTRIYFYPRRMSLVAEPAIAMLGRSGSVRGAISHLKTGPMAWSLALAARKGADIELLVHDTSRRVSGKVFQFLRRAGVRIERVVHPEGLPMHAKFLLVSNRNDTTAWLGSYNYNEKSRLRNAELLLATSDGQVIEQLSGRFEKIRSFLPTGAAGRTNEPGAAGS